MPVLRISRRVAKASGTSRNRGARCSRGGGLELGYVSLNEMLGMFFLAALVWWEFRRGKKMLY